MLTLYNFLLYLYPASYRREFAEEMTAVFCDARCAPAPGRAGRIGFYAREIRGLLTGALGEHLRRLLGPGVPFRRFDMRPQFRFPRSTVFLMLVIFAGVVLTIARASEIVQHYSAVGSVWPALLSVLILMPVGMGVIAAIGWTLLHSVRRTGVHRMANMQTWPEQR